MKKSKVEIVRDETIKATEGDDEVVKIDIKCEKGKMEEHKERKSIICLTFDKEGKGIESIVAGSFSPKELMQYIDGLDTLKNQMIKNLAGMMSEGLDQIIKTIEQEED